MREIIIQVIIHALILWAATALLSAIISIMLGMWYLTPVFVAIAIWDRKKVKQLRSVLKAYRFNNTQ